ncbi:glycosyltransferase family protein [Polynucleobacter paneuropaeus]|uniref:hypothetical protein n=1 Tax=Polynucleobacter paneuropaeus TaxID=2527775 RepID=UPI00131403F1|nr:hypothetical protein [Polynucleobacter paneuropaeus]
MAELIFFSDQDDIWLEGKIIDALKFFNKQDNEMPILYLQNGCSFSDKNGLINKYIQICRPKKIEDFFFLNGGLYGCCMAFNAKMRDKYVDSLPLNIFMHDHHMTMAALSFARIEYSNVKCIFYRRHLNNVSGGPLSNYKKATNFIFSDVPIINPKSFEAINLFFLKNKFSLTKNDIIVFKIFLDFNALSFMYKLFYIFKYNFNIYNSKIILIYKLLMR